MTAVLYVRMCVNWLTERNLIAIMFKGQHYLKQLFSVALVSAVALSPLATLSLSAENDSADRAFWFFGKKKKNKSDSEAEKAVTVTDYERLTGDENVLSRGMFNVLRKDKDYYFEIPDSMMGRDMLVINKFVKVPMELNEAGANRGLSNSDQMVRFELDSANAKVIVRKIRPLPLVPEGDAIARSVCDNYISPVIAKFKIEAYNEDSTSVIIRINDIYDGTKTSFNDVFTDINIGQSANSDLSRIISIKAFDNNIHAISELTTRVSEPGGSVYVTIEVGSSLVLLPEKPMKRRFASPRVGFFTESALRYGDKQQRVSRGHFITRWRLEPKKGQEADYLAGKLVEPEKPIVFWLDRSTPVQWRKYIRQGIEDWNSAFEFAGFKNAIRCEQLTDSIDVDLDDVSYSVLNYAASEKSNAMGPSIMDPRTGEILEADIMWWHNVLDLLHDWVIIQTGAVDPRARTLELPEELLGDAMRFVACHEVGHSLGLRHNMMASAAIPTDSLRSRSYIRHLGGTSASIMDYARFNYVAQPGDSVEVLSPHIGPYDCMAINYGYRWYGIDDPEEEYDLLQELLDNHQGSLYRYSEAQDSREAIDPRALSEDLGDNAMQSARYGIANLKRIMPEIISWTTTGRRGQDYDEASRLYYSAVSQWQLYCYHVLSNIGGIYVDNTTVGDGQLTYRFVEPERQRDAVRFIIDEVLTQPAWLFDADVSNYTFLVRNTPIGRQENSPNYILKNAQSYILWDLLSDNRIIRMYENEAMNGSKAFRPGEMMDMLHEGIFAKTIRGVTPDVRERSVQKNFVDNLIIAASENRGVKDGAIRSAADADADPAAMMIDDPSALYCSHCRHEAAERQAIGERNSGRRHLNFYGSQGNRVSDAISLKRGELMRIRTLLISRIPSASRDARYHYEDLIMRINTALGIAQLKN